MGLSVTDGSASIGTTEFYLASNSTLKTDQTDDCLLQVWIDFGAMTATERYQVKFYEKVQSGAQQTIMPEIVVTGVQSSLCVLPTMFVATGWEIGVTKLLGTDRTIRWSLRKVT